MNLTSFIALNTNRSTYREKKKKEKKSKIYKHLMRVKNVSAVQHPFFLDLSAFFSLLWLQKLSFLLSLYIKHKLSLWG